jgi:hypothetical protein
MLKNMDLDKLADILDSNRDISISENHWQDIRGFVEKNHRRFVQEEKTLALSSEDLHKAFSL